MAQRTLMRTDKNGTKYYHCVDRCCKCGGTGIVRCYIHVNGGECFDCGGSGISEWEEKEYTPEYEAKLQAQREKRFEKKNAEEMAKAAERNAEFFKKNGFTADGKTYFVLGNTYDIKEELKAQGAKWDNVSSHWHMATKPEGRDVLELTVDDMYDADYSGTYVWNNFVRFEWNDPKFYVNKIKAAEDSLRAQNSTSVHVGQVGEKIEAVMTLVNRTSWESSYGYRGTITYLYTLKDNQGNVFVWKTGTYLKEDKGSKLHVSGTVKEHSEYKGINQTVLTRCKIQGVAA